MCSKRFLVANKLPQILESVAFSFRMSTILEICSTKQMEINVSPTVTYLNTLDLSKLPGLGTLWI